jgi:Zn-dependent M28 family amino/carboxypeptidase
MRSLLLCITLSSMSAFTQQPAMPVAPAVSGLPPATLAAEQQISPERIAAHTRFLSDDLLEGRGPGTRGGRLAALYLQTQFALLGLEPAGENGGWTQAVPMVNIATRPESTFTFSTGGGQQMNLTGGTDYTVTNQTAQALVDMNAAPIVFVGFGIHAPELGWDDYAGVDMKGKVALILVSQPPSPEPSATGMPHTPFTGKALTYYGRWTYKYEEAARQGAVGAILIHQTTMASYPWSVIGTRWGTETAFLAHGSEARVPLAAWVQFGVAEKLLAANKLDLAQLIVKARTPGFRAQPLASTLSAHVVSTVTPFTGQNVIAKLPGTSANHAAVLYTAHFDHLGIDHAAHGDQIYNGAIDNASADGMLLEVARGFAYAARDGGTPPGPIYFAAVDAEEQGLLGSEYLAQHPPVPAHQIALNLNFEGIFIMPGGIPQQLMVSGAERTSFLAEVDTTAKAFGMTIIPDPFPAAGYYYRSDHFSFARAGIPAFSIGAGNQFAGHDLAYGQAIAADYIAHRYHQPSDEFNPKWDLRAEARLAQLSIALGWQALLKTQPIVWNKGDEFEAPRLRSQQR